MLCLPVQYELISLASECGSGREGSNRLASAVGLIMGILFIPPGPIFSHGSLACSYR